MSSLAGSLLAGCRSGETTPAPATPAPATITKYNCPDGCSVEASCADGKLSATYTGCVRQDQRVAEYDCALWDSDSSKESEDRTEFVCARAKDDKLIAA